jgi:hypothetical protein
VSPEAAAGKEAASFVNSRQDLGPVWQPLFGTLIWYLDFGTSIISLRNLVPELLHNKHAKDATRKVVHVLLLK